MMYGRFGEPRLLQWKKRNFQSGEHRKTITATVAGYNLLDLSKVQDSIGDRVGWVDAL